MAGGKEKQGGRRQGAAGNMVGALRAGRGPRRGARPSLLRESYLVHEIVLRVSAVPRGCIAEVGRIRQRECDPHARLAGVFRKEDGEQRQHVTAERADDAHSPADGGLAQKLGAAAHDRIGALELHFGAHAVERALRGTED